MSECSTVLKATGVREQAHREKPAGIRLPSYGNAQGTNENIAGLMRVLSTA